MESTISPKKYEEGRFEFALYVDDKLVCKRNFSIRGFNEKSMKSIDFKYETDYVAYLIDEDLKSKSRIYTWFYDETCDEMKQDLIEPWKSTFKIIVYDNKREVITKIWDGRYYPKYIRDRVDIVNKNVKYQKSDGTMLSFEKNKFFEDHKDRLNVEQYFLRDMLSEREDIALKIQRSISDFCSMSEEMEKNRANEIKIALCPKIKSIIEA